MLKKSAPARLCTWKGRACFRLVEQNQATDKLRGITKRLQQSIWSAGTLPLIARKADPRIGGHWCGKKGGQTRGTRVDAQLTKLINAGPSAWKNTSHVYRLTKMVLSGLHAQGLEPVLAQRPVASKLYKLGTAADIVCYSKADNSLYLIELKCGYDHGRKAAALLGDQECKMQAPLHKAADCNVHRHLAQLAVTWRLFTKEVGMTRKLEELGVEGKVKAAVLYANDAGVELFPMTDWWERRGLPLLKALR